MKKTIVSLILSSIVLTGCGSEDLVSNVPAVQDTKTNTIVSNNSKVINKAPVNNQTTTINKVSEPSKINSVIQQANTIKRVNIAENYNTKNILVGLNSEADLSKVNALALKYNVKVDNFIKGINTVVISTNGQSAPELIKKLSAESLFSYVETDNIGTNRPENESDINDSLFSVMATDVVNDKYFKDQYGLTATHTVEAWNLSKGKNEVISVIDSGVDVDHTDLKNKVVSGYDAFSKVEGKKAGDTSVLNYISDTYKHGSHVAGIIAAEANNSKGIAGVAPEAKIMPVKIFPDLTDYFKTAKKNEDGSSVTVVSAIADGIVWSVDHKADVINMSLGLWEQSTTITKAVQYALDHNVSIVVAAGNERANGNRLNYLAALNGVIAVGATDENNKITYFSNSGAYVSVAAPGLDIISTTPSFLKLKDYRKMSGTSMASPHVAGIVALMKSKFGAVATPQWIKERLENTATDLGAEGRDDLYGHGLVNAYKALNDPI